MNPAPRRSEPSERSNMIGRRRRASSATQPTRSAAPQRSSTKKTRGSAVGARSANAVPRLMQRAEIARPASSRSFPEDVDDLVEMPSGRRRDRHLITDLAVDEGTRHRRGDRDGAILYVGFFGADDPEAALVSILVFEDHGRAELHAIASK